MATTNAYEIVISANDRASGVITAINAGLTAIGATARAIVTPIAAVSTGLANIATGSFNQFVSFIGLLNNLQTTITAIATSPIVSPLLATSLSAAEDAIQSLDASLTDTFTASGQLFGDLFAGAVPAIQQFQQASIGATAKVGTAFTGLGGQISASIGGALNRVDVALNALINKAQQIPQAFTVPFDNIANVFGGIAGFDEPLAVLDAVRTGVGGATQGIFELTQEIAFFSAGLQAAQQFVAQGPFELLIQQNVRLREQLLSTQATLVATNQVLQNGVQISDPTQAINALQQPINKAIADLRQGSLELVGVTSSELIPLFQQVAGESANIGASLDQAKELTLSFSAALGTLQIPLEQSRQEIGSILQGNISTDSILAKSLGLNNAMVQQWKQQGVAVDRLLEKLEAFRAGNALAAQTIGGVTSNIEEVFQEIGRLAGEPLLDPIVKEFDNFYQYLVENKDELARGFSDVIQILARSVGEAVKASKAVASELQATFAQIPVYLVKSLSNAITEVAKAVTFLVETLSPVLQVFGELASKAYALGGPFLRVFIVFKTLSAGVGLLSGAFGVLAQALPGVGELLFFLSGRNNSLVRSFIGLRSEIGQGAAGFLLLGKNLAGIPPLFNLLAQQVPIFGTAIASLTPAVASLAIQGIGLLKVYPQVGTVFANLTKLLPAAATSIAPIANQLLPGLGQQLQFAAGQAATFGSALAASTASDRIAQIEKLTNATGRFSGLMQLLGKFLGESVVKFGLLAGGVFIALKAFDLFILKNEDLLAGLETIGGFLVEVGKNVLEFFSNPFVVATTAVLGLAAALQAGVLPAILELGKSFAAVAGSNIAANFSKLTNILAGVSDRIRNFRLFPDFGKQLDELQGASAQIRSQLRGQSQAFQEAIAQRRRQVAELNAEIKKTSQTADGGGLLSRLFGDPDKVREQARQQLAALQAQRQALLDETKQIVADRQGLKDQLATVEGQIADINERQAKRSARVDAFRNFSADFGKNVLGTLTQIGGAVTKVSGEVSQKLGRSLSSAGLTAFGDAAFNTGLSLQGLGVRVLAADVAQKSFIGTTNTASISLVGLSTALKAGITSFASFVTTIATSVSGFLAAAAPLAALTAAIFVVTEAVGAYTSVAKASSQAAKDLASAFKEADEAIDSAARERAIVAGQNIIELLESEVDLRQKRIEEIKKEKQGFVDVAQAVRDLTNDLLDLPIINILDNLPGLEQLNQILDAIPKAIDALNGRRAEVEVDAETVGVDKAIDVAQDRLKEFQKDYQKSVDLEQELANAQGERAKAQADGDETGVRQIDRRIKAIQGEIDARKKAADAAIEQLEAVKAVSPAQQAELSGLIQAFKDYRTQLDEIPNIEITPPDLPKLGTLFEQLAQRSANALSEIQKGTGTQEFLQQQNEIVLETTKIERQLGAITAEEARRRFKIIADNESSTAEQVQSAQDAITESYESNAATRTQILDAEIAETERLRASGQITGTEADRRVTQAREEQLQERIDLLREAYAEEIRTGQGNGEKAVQLQKEIAQLELDIIKNREDAKLKAINEAADKALQAASDAEKRRQIQVAQLQRDRLLSDADAGAIEAEANKQRIQEELTIERQRLQELQKNAVANAGAIRDSQSKILDLTLGYLKAEESAYDAHIARINAALDRQINEYTTGLQNALNEGLITSEELAAEQARLQVSRLNILLQNEKLSVEERAALQLQLAQAQGQAQQAQESSIRSQIERENTLRETLLQESINRGLVTERDANRRRVQDRMAAIEAEIAAEGISVRRREELQLELARAERELQQANAEFVEERINREAQAFENRIELQNQKLEAQAQLYDAIAQALEYQAELLQARSDLISAEADSLGSILGNLQEIEVSEVRRRELQQAAALIELESLQSRLAIEEQVLELKQEQQRIALETQAIENEAAQARLEAQIARGQANVTRAEGQFARGEISQEELNAARLDQRANFLELSASRQQQALLQRQISILPQQQEAERQQFRIQANTQLADAFTSFFQSLPAAEQARSRGQAQQTLSGLLGFGDYNDLTTFARSQGREGFNQIREGRGTRLNTGTFDSLIDPGSQRILGGLENVTEPQALIDLNQQSVTYLDGILRTLQDISGQSFRDTPASAGLIETVGSIARAPNELPIDRVQPYQNIQLSNRPLPQLQVPGALPQLPAIAAPQAAQPQLNPEELGRRIAESYSGRMRQFRESDAAVSAQASPRIEAPITVNVQAQARDFREVEEQTYSALEKVVTRAQRQYGSYRNSQSSYAN